LKPTVRAGLIPVVSMSRLAIGMPLIEKVAIVGSLIVVSTLTIVLLRRRAILRDS